MYVQQLTDITRTPLNDKFVALILLSGLLNVYDPNTSTKIIRDFVKIKLLQERLEHECSNLYIKSLTRPMLFTVSNIKIKTKTQTFWVNNQRFQPKMVGSFLLSLLAVSTCCTGWTVRWLIHQYFWWATRNCLWFYRSHNP